MTLYIYIYIITIYINLLEGISPSHQVSIVHPAQVPSSVPRYLEGPEHKESNDDLMLCVSATNRRYLMVSGSLMGKLSLEITIFAIVSSTNFLVISVLWSSCIHPYPLPAIFLDELPCLEDSHVTWFTIHLSNPPCLTVQFISALN